jgi:Domain of unknown function (DUF4189)
MRTRWKAGLAIFLVASGFCLRGQEPGSTLMTPDEACILALGILGCENMGRPNGGSQMVVLHFAALALSPSSMTAGGSHGRNSMDEAETVALQNCRRASAKDCRVLTSSENGCLAFAPSYSDRRYGYSAAGNRTAAATDALNRCRNAGGKSCFVLVAPCADDDVKWTSPLPLPMGVQGGKVDPALVGTWSININPGRWVWRVAANGTYELHSEAMDNTPSNAGTFSASNGHYTLHAITMPWDDQGTYTMQSPTVVVATGKLGTGTWRKIAGASSTVTRAAPARSSGPPITIRK